MFSTLFNSKPIIDAASREWIFDTFAWCLNELDGDFFNNNSQLILPNNTFYPGNSSSVEAMAEIIFANTLKYSGLSEWPIQLIATEFFIQKPMPQLLFESALRGKDCIVTTSDSVKINGELIIPTIDIAFHASQLNQPQDLIAYLVQRQAHILVTQHGVTAPGGHDVIAQTIDLVACFMGFGVIFSNTAYQFKGGCGSCNNRNLNRQPALPEIETVYALALFCVLKGEDIKPIKKALKSHLYKSFQQAYKDISLYLQQTTNPVHAQLSNPS